MEADNELKANNNSYDFGARIYDPRIGRWLSVDPLVQDYPSLNPYNFAGNNPIVFVDIDGMKIVPFSKISYSGKFVLKSVHDLGNTKVSSFNYTPGQNGSVGTLKINITITLTKDFAEGGRLYYYPNAKINRENPGLHTCVLGHEKVHKDQYFKIIQEEDFSLTINGNTYTGKIDEVYNNLYLEVEKQEQKDLTKIANYEIQNGPLSKQAKAKALEMISNNKKLAIENAENILIKQINYKLIENYNTWDVKTKKPITADDGIERYAITENLIQLSKSGEWSAWEYQNGKPVKIDGKVIPSDTK